MILILASGFNLKHMDMEFTHGKMGISTKVSGKCVLSMELVLINSILATPIKVIIRMANLMVMANTLGVMGLSTQVNSIREDDMVKASGEVIVHLLVILTRVIMSMI